MLHLNSTIYNPYNIPLKVWVLAPFVQTNDENLDYYYDFSQSIAEYARTFDILGLQWLWQPVTMSDYREIIAGIAAERDRHNCLPVILNICDGDEVNGSPGISVVNLLQELGLVYTGAEAFYYDVTTSKIAMKKAFDNANVPTARWEAITHQSQDTRGIFERLGSPIIIKPSVSGGSMGVGTKNVVYNELELNALVIKMFEGYRGWNLVTDGLIAESFITGPEYTCFIVGSHNKADKAIIYEPVERVFHASLPEYEKILSFDRLWEIYEEETAMPDDGNFYEYECLNTENIAEVKKLSWDAYVSVKGTGYTRIDLRLDKNTGKLYILEANAQCGISEDEDFTSIGAILRISGKSFPQLVKEIICDAIDRKGNSVPITIQQGESLVNDHNAG